MNVAHRAPTAARDSARVSSLDSRLPRPDSLSASFRLSRAADATVGARSVRAQCDPKPSKVTDHRSFCGLYSVFKCAAVHTEAHHTGQSIWIICLNETGLLWLSKLCAPSCVPLAAPRHKRYGPHTYLSIYLRFESSTWTHTGVEGPVREVTVGRLSKGPRAFVCVRAVGGGWSLFSDVGVFLWRDKAVWIFFERKLLSFWAFGRWTLRFRFRRSVGS